MSQFLLLNTDRHFSNIEFLIDNETLKVIELAPIFDNNFSLLPRFIEEFDIFDRSEYKVRDDSTFDDLYSVVKKYKNYKKELVKLKRFRLEKPETVDISDTRLKFLNRFIHEQVGYLLSR